MQQPFIPNHIYKRSSIHDEFGGNRQSGISPSAKFPYIFIFSGKTGKQHGYQDGWDNPNVYSYTGHGQDGDMNFSMGNLALRDHVKNGKRVFLFESEKTKGFVKFISELEFFDVDYFPTHDTVGQQRMGIKFFLKRAGAYLPIEPSILNEIGMVAENLIDYEIKIPNITERQGLVTSRVGQGAYRKRIIHRWEYQCAVTGFDKPNLLIASHIVPWAEANDHERLDVHNGILLSPTYDALFDRHLISFEDNGKIILSSSIKSNDFQKIGVTGSETIKGLSNNNLGYIEKHRSILI
ncbi:MAG: HNH endonuclease signature motif containing protein [Bacteroidia bacterium]